MHGVGNSSSVWEYALFTSGNASWIGNRHDHDIQTGLTITVDGAAVTLADGESESGSSTVIVTRTSEFYDDTDTTKIGDVTTVYTMTPDYGLNVETSIVMIGETVTAGHRAMMPFDYFMDMGHHANWPIYRKLSNDDGDQTFEQLETDAMLGYEIDGDYAILVVLPAQVAGCFFQDRASAQINKVYCPNDQLGASVSFSQRYMVRYGSTSGMRKH